MTYTILILSNNWFGSLQWLGSSLKIFSKYSEFVFCAFNQSWYNGMVVFGIHIVNSWNPATSMGQISLFNYIASANKY